MTQEKEDYTILHAGYMKAIDDVLQLIDDETLKNKIIRKSKMAFNEFPIFEGAITKYYYKEHNLGVVLYDSTFEFKGFMIDIEKGTYNILDDKELIYVKINWENIHEEKFKDEFIMNEKYNYYLSQWKKAEN